MRIHIWRRLGEGRSAPIPSGGSAVSFKVCTESDAPNYLCHLKAHSEKPKLSVSGQLTSVFARRRTLVE